MAGNDDTRPDRRGAMFRSSRRVSFVMRTAEGARRFASIRASRDPFASVEVDVQTAEPIPVEDRPKRQPPRKPASHIRAEKPSPAIDAEDRVEHPPEPVEPTAAAPKEMSVNESVGEVSEQSKPPEPTADDAVRLRALTAPRAFPDALQENLADALIGLKDEFDAALLFQADYMDGHSEFLLAISGAQTPLHDTIEAAVNTAMSSYTKRNVELGMTFLDAEDPMAVRISRVGTRLV